MKHHREKQILDYINQHGFASADDLAEELKISSITIRRDFIKLEKENLLVRVHGGAIPVQDSAPDTHISTRLNTNIREKFRVVNYAAALIEKNETIFLDAGSTCYYLAEAMPENKNIRVITHSLNNIISLKNKTGIEVICIGGEYSKKVGAFIGALTEEQYNAFHVDRAFVSTIGISQEMGCVINNIEEAKIKAIIHSHSRHSYILADSSKFTTHAIYSAIPVSEIKTIITDDGAGESLTQAFLNRGIDVIRA
jgi:DeoR/GlpR family transcriptional regulator of sugar metabolism